MKLESRVREKNAGLWGEMQPKVLNMCKVHVTNEEARRRIQVAFGEYDELLTVVKKRKLRRLHLKVLWFSKDDSSYRTQ